MEKIILTGDRPTGKLHIGHYVGSLKRRIELQNSGEYDKIYVMIADLQALTDNLSNPQLVADNRIEVLLDYLACGIDMNKSKVIVQSRIPTLCELSFLYMNFVSVQQLQKNPTLKAELKQKNYIATMPLGFFTYPVSQAADITAFKATTVPAGEDQIPMIDFTKDIVNTFNGMYGNILTSPEILLPTNNCCRRLPGTDGKAKMSKSLNNCIYLSDEPDTIVNKIKSMPVPFRQLSDPGVIENNILWTYLEAFKHNVKDYTDLKVKYTFGGIADEKIKQILTDAIICELDPIRIKRKEFEKSKVEYMKLSNQQSAEATLDTIDVVDAVREALKLD